MPPRSLYVCESPAVMGLLGFPSGASLEFNRFHFKTAGVVAAGHYDRVFALMWGCWTADPRTGIRSFAYQYRDDITPDHWTIAIRERHPLPGDGWEAHLVEVTGWKDREGAVHPMTEMPPGSMPPPGLSEGQVMAWRLDF